MTDTILAFTSPQADQVRLIKNGIETVGPWPADDGDWQRRVDAAIAETGEPAPYEPPPAPPPMVTGLQVLTLINDTDIAKLKDRDRLRLAARGLDEIPVDGPFIGRIADKLGKTVERLMSTAD